MAIALLAAVPVVHFKKPLIVARGADGLAVAQFECCEHTFTGQFDARMTNTHASYNFV